MFIATIALSVLLAAAVLGSGAAKLAAAKQSIEIRDRLGVAAGLWRGIGVLEVAAAVGLAAGLAVPALGIAAAVGLALLLIGAIGAHARSHNHNGEERSAAADVGHIGGGRYARVPSTRVRPPQTASYTGLSQNTHRWVADSRISLSTTRVLARSM